MSFLYINILGVVIAFTFAYATYKISNNLFSSRPKQNSSLLRKLYAYRVTIDCAVLGSHLIGTKIFWYLSKPKPEISNKEVSRSTNFGPTPT